MNVGETVVYDAVKDYLVGQGRMKEGVPAHLSRCNDDIQKPPFVGTIKNVRFLSAVVAGVSATLVASPVDVVKTRYVKIALFFIHFSWFFLSF